MSDIVERLRTDQAWNDAGNDPGGLQGDIWGEAANEIEHLRADNERLRAAIRETLYMDDSGHVACQFYSSKNLADIAPVLTEVLEK